MKIKAIVFDKDGTLVDYEKFWIPVARYATELIFEKAGIDKSRIDKHMRALGAVDGVIDIRSPLARGDHKAIIDLIYGEMKNSGIDLGWEAAAELMILGYGKESKLVGEVCPTCENMREVLKSLRDIGIRLALITSDEIGGAELCLERLGIRDLFDKILAADSTVPPKPDPYFMDSFRAEFGYERDEVMMVGDTETDILFAKNSGVYSVGVGKTEENLEYLAGVGADSTLLSVAEIPKLLSEL